MYWLSAAADECQECQGEAPQNKAGVAMLVKTHHAKHASGIESTEGIEREATLIRKVLTSPTAELSQSMVEELAAMRITPEVAAFINGTLTNLEAVFGDIVDASDEDTKARDDFLKTFDELSVNLTAAAEQAVNIRSGVEKARNEHTDCRAQEKVALEAKKKMRRRISSTFQEERTRLYRLRHKNKGAEGLDMPLRRHREFEAEGGQG